MSEVSLDALLASKDVNTDNEKNNELMPVSDNIPDLSKQSFSEQDKLQISKIKDEIDFMRNTDVLQYGSEAQGNISRFSDQILENVRAKDSGHVGELLSSLTSKVLSYFHSNRCIPV